MSALDALNRLTKWRSFFAGWQLGTQPETHGPTRAVRDHREATMILRVEVTALTRALLEKGVLTQDELAVLIEDEANELAAAYERRFPGFRATDDGMSLEFSQATETMQREGFPR